jgi:hypothetical protein
MRPFVTSFVAAAIGACAPRIRLFPWVGLPIALCLLLSGAVAQEQKPPSAKDDFSPLVKLAPFVVNGQSLAISIYARTNSDRRYGEEFADGVVKVVYEAVTPSTGKGLVIIGSKSEPHPIFVFRQFLALAKEGKLDPAVAALGPQLIAMMDRWQPASDDAKSSDGSGKDGEMKPEDAKIVPALPMPLEGVGAKLYQLAWEEKFDDAKVAAKMRGLRPADLGRRDLFKRFDWVLYLPPKGAFDQVVDDLIARALKDEKVGFFASIAVKGVLLAMKPKIRRSIEGMREGMMFMTIVGAQAQYSEEDVSELADAYVEVFSLDGKSTGGSDHERAVKAVRDKLREIEEKERKKEGNL